MKSEIILKLHKLHTSANTSQFTTIADRHRLNRQLPVMFTKYGVARFTAAVDLVEMFNSNQGRWYLPKATEIDRNLPKPTGIPKAKV